MKFPSIKDVARELQSINESDLTDPDADACIDVRLQVTADGWEIHSGDAQYDTDHKGHWGASSVPGNGKRFNSTDIARALISEARDSHAQSGGK
jgi:hypothetical protein